jgi:hypothetical protein
MARINYGALTVAIEDILSASAELRNWEVTIEAVPSLPIPVNKIPHIGIFEEARSLTSGQPIASGQRTRYTLRWRVVVSALGKTYRDASQARDEILGLVEVALMNNRSLGGALSGGSLTLGGGDFASGAVDSGGLIAQASLTLTAEETASTV